jgi:hypothetical protein
MIRKPTKSWKWAVSWSLPIAILGIGAARALVPTTGEGEVRKAAANDAASQSTVRAELASLRAEMKRTGAALSRLQGDVESAAGGRDEQGAVNPAPAEVDPAESDENVPPTMDELLARSADQVRDEVSSFAARIERGSKDRAESDALSERIRELLATELLEGVTLQPAECVSDLCRVSLNDPKSTQVSRAVTTLARTLPGRKFAHFEAESQNTIVYMERE